MDDPLHDRATKWLYQHGMGIEGWSLVRDLWQEVQRLRVDLENAIRWRTMDAPPTHPAQVELFFRKSGKRALGYWDGRQWASGDPNAPQDDVPTHYRLLPQPPV